MTEDMLDFLGKLIAFPSISADGDMASESKKTADLIKDNLEKLGAVVNIYENEVKGKNPILMAKLGDDPSKKTLLCYSHYDVQPADIEDGWDTEPFEMIKKDGYVYGRGVNDDKGPITALYFAIKDLLAEGELPVNIRWLYEGEEESSSGGFEETVEKHKDFLGNVDGLIILDTSWFGDKTPSMDYGFRGIIYMTIEITGPNADQHSGLVGGTIREPMTDLSFLFTRLIDLDGKILIDNFYDDVKPLTDDEKKLYENIEYDLEGYKKFLGLEKVISDDANTVLMDGWRNPSLSIHGVEKAFSGKGAKTVVPGTVIGKVSCRLVPDQSPKKMAEIFIKYVEKEFEKLNSPNKMKVSSLGEGDWWLGNVDNFLYKAGHKAIKQHWKMEPSYARSGGSIPIIPFMEKLFDAPAIGLGVGQSTDGAHSQNERLRIKNLEGAREVLKLMFKEIGN
ncbi:MAG: M20/M25/M40 family metallo-hydrolase [Candidatus Heimdallarchaeota archaeon]|nr:M20/M25/M40 family metallo-hydrolase [Candidatus Heimdallarchaeota archaeon]